MAPDGALSSSVAEMEKCEEASAIARRIFSAISSSVNAVPARAISPLMRRSSLSRREIVASLIPMCVTIDRAQKRVL